MGKELKYLVIHTTDTSYYREISADDIFSWHLGAKLNSTNDYTFFGEHYTKKDLKGKTLKLPSGRTVNALDTWGNGWKQVGYSDLIQRSGETINLTPYDFDGVVDQFEITNGASGYNSTSRHVVLAGGWTSNGKIKNGHVAGDLSKSYLKINKLYTEAQIKSLISWIRMQLIGMKASGVDISQIKVIGHNEVSGKTCPNFNVQVFLKDYKVLKDLL